MARSPVVLEEERFSLDCTPEAVVWTVLQGGEWEAQEVRLQSNNKAEPLKNRLHGVFKVSAEDHERYLEESVRHLNR